MIDLFGLRKHEETVHVPSHSGEKRLWAVLLVLDTVIMFVFAGAVASSLWTGWQKGLAPSGPARPARIAKVPPPPRKDAAPPPVETKPVPQPAAPVSPPPVVAKKISAASRRIQRETAAESAAPASTLPSGSPNVMAPSLPRHEAELVGTRQTASASPAVATTSSTDKPKAKSVEFICHAKQAQEVLLKGPFLVRTGGVKKMIDQNDGTWRLTISLLPGSYKYRCVIDGVKYKIESIDVP